MRRFCKRFSMSTASFVGSPSLRCRGYHASAKRESLDAQTQQTLSISSNSHIPNIRPPNYYYCFIRPSGDCLALRHLAVQPSVAQPSGAASCHLPSALLQRQRVIDPCLGDGARRPCKKPFCVVSGVFPPTARSSLREVRAP